MWTVRPQVISFFLLALLNLWLEKRDQLRTPPLFLLPVLFIAWVNIHGGFIWGFLLLFATLSGMILDLLGQKIRNENINCGPLKQLAFWTFISMLAVFFNPNGMLIWRLPFYTINVSITVIQEWFSPNFHNLEIQPLFSSYYLLISFRKKEAALQILLKH
jgi:hypothetical protein